jgi:hypothetical protein
LTPSEGNGNGFIPAYDPQNTTSGDTTQQSTATAVDPLMAMLASIFSQAPTTAQNQGGTTLQSLLSHPLIQQALQQHRARQTLAQYPKPVRIPIPPPFPLGSPRGFPPIAGPPPFPIGELRTQNPQPVKPIALDTSAAMAMIRAIAAKAAGLPGGEGMLRALFGGNVGTVDTSKAAPMAPAGSVWDIITRLSRS